MTNIDSPEKPTTLDTDFGYQRVAVQEKKHKVAAVFNSVATKYDLMNDLMSLGIHRWWKRYTIMQSGVRAGHTVLDLAGGTGDLTKQFVKLVGSTGEVILSDINDQMLEMGRSRLLDEGITRVNYVQANAECLPFPDNYFDCITIAFGLRNVTFKDKALSSMLRVLKPGGKVLILEFSKPMLPLLQKIYDSYSFSLLPKLGSLIAGDAESYQYLVESIRMHPDQEQLKQLMESVGLEDCRYENLSGGIVALHIGYKY